MQHAVLLAAGIGDLLEGLIPLLFLGIWIVSQVMAAFRKAAKAQPAARPQPIRPVPPPPQGGPGRPPEIDREIEELLRRTLGVEPVRQPPVTPRPPKQQKPKPKPRKETVATASRPPERTGRGSGSDVARHVEEAFAHDLAHASPSGTAIQGAAVTASPAAELIASLRSPEDLRRLMIVREILDVPTHRW